jgi:hypothetical protein
MRGQGALHLAALVALLLMGQEGRVTQVRAERLTTVQEALSTRGRAGRHLKVREGLRTKALVVLLTTGQGARALRGLVDRVTQALAAPGSTVQGSASKRRRCAPSRAGGPLHCADCARYVKAHATDYSSSVDSHSGVSLRASIAAIASSYSLRL